MSTQVSGSISLDLHKVVRQVIQGTADELVRSEPTEQEREHGFLTPLDVLSRTVCVEVLKSVMPELAQLQTQLEALTALVRAEAERRDRVQVTSMGPGAIAEIRQDDNGSPGQQPEVWPVPPVTSVLGPPCEHGSPVTSQTPSQFPGAQPIRHYADGCQSYGSYQHDDAPAPESGR